MPIVACIECDAKITFDEKVILGEIAQCPECSLELEVVKLDPLEVDKAPEVEEDWGE